MNKPHRRPDRRAAFTLSEMMVAVAIVSLAMAMAMGFFIESLKASFVSEQKNNINADIRQLTGELSDIAREANFAILYRSFSNSDRDSVSDRLLDGNPGDFLLFGFQDEPNLENPLFAPRATTRLVGYYRAPANPADPESEGPVRRFDIDIPAPGNIMNPPAIETLIPDDSEIKDFPEVVPLSEGLADGRLFYNFGRGTIMVNGKIIHGVAAKRVTDTYNFTIATRR